MSSNPNGLWGLASGNAGFGGGLGALASEAGSGLGIYSGLQQAAAGNPVGYARAGVNAGQLAGKAGWLGNPSSAANQGFGDAANALGIYSGIRQGGISGDTGAAINAGQLGLKGAVQSGLLSKAGAAPYLSALNYAAIPLDLYNEIKSYQSGNTGSDALSGAETGAAIGSVIPGIGTLVGGVVGGAAGALASAFGPGKKDAETSYVQNVIDATGKYGNNPNVAASVQDPYLELAGLMDRRSSTLPEYQQYGRMGEQKFTNDLVGKINQAVQGDPSLAKDPNAVYNKVVSPWVNSMGSGYRDVGSTYTATNQGLIEDMVNQYLSGNAASDWKAVGGDSPFSDIYKGSPISQAPSAPPVHAQMNAGVRNVGRMSDGGRAKRKSILDSIRPSFETAPKTHFDDGGLSYFEPFTNASDATPWEDQITYPTDGGGSSSQPPIQDPSQETYLQQNDVNQYLNSSSDPANAGSSGGGGALSGLGGLAKSAAPYAAALPLLGALANKLGGTGSPGSSSLPSNQSTGPTGPFPAQASPRTRNAIDPNTDWYTYGQHPETEFFSNNSIGPLMGKFTAHPSSGPAASMPAPGGSPPPSTSVQPVVGPSPITHARGGALDMAEAGPESDGSRYVTGPGDGQSDDIDAKLSNGEYVMDAHTVSLLGNGSNEAGAKRLDELRMNLRKHAAKPMAKGKQFMKAKPPEAYLRGGK